jgi:hypothetical protein
MDKRNNIIHGNVDPEIEQVERVYFDGKIPLFEQPGDHIGKFFEALERQHDPETAIKDYEDTHTFLLEIVACLEPEMVPAFWQVMEAPYPGYDLRHNIAGCLFPDHVLMDYVQGFRYDDELPVNW